MEATGGSINEALAEALRARRPRFFRASRGSAKGKTGPEDTGRFAENLMILQECALLVGEKLQMNSVVQAAYFEGEETAGFCFDPNSNPQNPDVAGAIVNRRMSLREFFQAVREFAKA